MDKEFMVVLHEEEILSEASLDLLKGGGQPEGCTFSCSDYKNCSVDL